MQIIRKRAYARAGLLGNPSDGFHGKTISMIVKNFWAEVVLYEWDEIEIVLTEQDAARFHSVDELVNDVRLHGYYGGIRLVKATIKRFTEYCRKWNLPLHPRNFSIRYTSNIPRQVGLAGSSSIIVATLRCLMEYYGVYLPVQVQPSFVLSVEKEELGISAGLQDRVIQVYEGLVYMDFSPQIEERRMDYVCYSYEPLDAALLPPVYVAWHAGLSEPTEIFHNDLGGRYRRGEKAVLRAMEKFADIALKGKQALLDGNHALFSSLMNKNFDLRKSISRLPGWQVEMVEVARDCGASAKFAGSGGAIVGTYCGEAMLQDLVCRFEKLNVRVFLPDVGIEKASDSSAES